MTFFDYLDLKFRTKSLELRQKHSLICEGELKAAYTLIQWQRGLYKAMHMPLLIVKFWLTKAGALKPLPDPQASPTAAPKKEEGKATAAASAAQTVEVQATTVSH